MIFFNDLSILAPFLRFRESNFMYLCVSCTFEVKKILFK